MQCFTISGEMFSEPSMIPSDQFAASFARFMPSDFSRTVTSSEEGEVFWTTLEEMKQKKLAYGMDKMLEVFLDETISEYFFYKEDGKWVEELK